jgi:hypothetical protein
MGKTGQRIQGGVALLVLAGAGGAWYVYNHDPALKRQFSQAVSVAKPVPKPPANAPVGFNATKTAFVLPHKLGYLPAPELALAKSDPAYAAGLVGLKDWTYIKPPFAPTKGTGETKADQMLGTGWFYGPNWRFASLKFALMQTWNVPLALNEMRGIPGFHLAMASATVIPVRSSALNQLPGGSLALPPGAYTVVTPSFLEVQAAPIGSLTVHRTRLDAYCVPSPEALIRSGHVIAGTTTTFTAGPSAVFASRVDGHTYYDQGVASCNGFS